MAGVGEMQHEFIVNNGSTWVHELANAGTEYGCQELVPSGVTPNQVQCALLIYKVQKGTSPHPAVRIVQFGTWIFGRAGWCPGVSTVQLRVCPGPH